MRKLSERERETEGVCFLFSESNSVCGETVVKKGRLPDLAAVFCDTGKDGMETAGLTFLQILQQSMVTFYCAKEDLADSAVEFIDYLLHK